MARLKTQFYKDIIGEYPELEIILKKHIFSYKGTRKIFIYKILMQIEYLRNISYEVFHNIFMYNFE